MGCDIHLVVERKRAKDTTWTGIFSSDNCPKSRPPVAQRDYDFFAEIANVRGHGSRYPQNVPEDISALAWQEYMSAPTDHHSASHMPIAEFAAVHNKINPEKSRAEHAVYDLFGVSPEYADEDEGPAEFRVVFWFDN
jgi:hypothetical protein